MSSKPVLKTGMDLSKQEMELFPLHLDLQSKNFFYEMFLIFTNEFKTSFENRKWIYPNRNISYFFNSNQKLLLQNVSYFNQWFWNQFWKQEMELFLLLLHLQFWNREMELSKREIIPSTSWKNACPNFFQKDSLRQIDRRPTDIQSDRQINRTDHHT